MDHSAATGQQTTLPGTTVHVVNPWLVFGAASFVYMFFNWYLQSQVLTDQVYTYTFGAQVNPDKLNAFLDGQHRTSVFGYVFVPLMMLFKMSLVSLCIYAGLVLTSQSLSFPRIFRIVLVAESATVAGTLVKLLVLAFSHPVESLGQYLAFAPLSLYSLFKSVSIPNWLVYPLQTLDLFQVMYVCLLAKGLQHQMKKPFRSSLEMVIGSYGVGLAVCIIGFAFISAIYNP
ncbi:MAG TPA: hypothetical protein VGM89_12380 [Puia sp.]|jgi:hypothetical protein